MQVTNQISCRNLILTVSQMKSEVIAKFELMKSRVKSRFLRDVDSFIILKMWQEELIRDIYEGGEDPKRHGVLHALIESWRSRWFL